MTADENDEKVKELLKEFQETKDSYKELSKQVKELVYLFNIIAKNEIAKRVF